MRAVHDDHAGGPGSGGAGYGGAIAEGPAGHGDVFPPQRLEHLPALHLSGPPGEKKERDAGWMLQQSRAVPVLSWPPFALVFFIIYFSRFKAVECFEVGGNVARRNAGDGRGAGRGCLLVSLSW